jgi:hypothetical protein
MRGERGATQAMVEEAVHASMHAHGGGTEALEEKVKECGRMILRMGSELMEETKCRLTVEAEVQELRLRLAAAEVAATRAPYSGGGGAAPLDPGGFPGGDYQPGAAAAAAFDQAVRSSLPDSPPRCSGGGGGGGGGGACWSSGVEQAVRSRMKELPRGSGSASATLASSASYNQLISGQPAAAVATRAAPATAAAAGSAALASAARPPRREGSGGAPLTGSAAALRLSREELDARVQQILGRVQSQPPPSGSPTGGAAP